jgi:GH15 family glucan-1,4-alpha-glucosidase
MTDSTSPAPSIADYALIGDCRTAALVSKTGSIDWFCAPRFDSPACFAALLGSRDNGRWLIAPDVEVKKVTRQYRGETLVLETLFETAQGSVALIDCMAISKDSNASQIARVVEGRSGRVTMRLDLVIRFGYGKLVPWVTRAPAGIRAIAGPDAVHVYSEVPLHGENMHTVARFEVEAGAVIPFALTYHPSHIAENPPTAPCYTVQHTEAYWKQWSARSRYSGQYRNEVQRSLCVLKALTYMPTGGIVAAPTTSLPEFLGGERNWDYRLCWIRDATITLYALLLCGYTDEARSWREWLLRAVAGTPDQLQVIYGVSGERDLLESELSWLSGFAGSRPVRAGNAAHRQLQLDVFGELMDAMHLCRSAHMENIASWAVEKALLGFLENHWRKPDASIWEVRGPNQQFTFSKVMAWVAFDRAIKAVEIFGRDGPVERWRAIRDEIHAEVCARGFSTTQNAFVQSYGSEQLDASLLQIPMVGFLPPADPRVRGTLAAIERDLTIDRTFVLRYKAAPEVDGLPAGEGAFLACSFWLVSNLVMQDRRDEACELFERLLAIQNDVGLLAEEYDPRTGEQLGNFPQAFSHLALVDAAQALSEESSAPPAHRLAPERTTHAQAESRPNTINGARPAEAPDQTMRTSRRS